MSKLDAAGKPIVRSDGKVLNLRSSPSGPGRDHRPSPDLAHVAGQFVIMDHLLQNRRPPFGTMATTHCRRTTAMDERAPSVSQGNAQAPAAPGPPRAGRWQGADPDERRFRVVIENVSRRSIVASFRSSARPGGGCRRGGCFAEAHSLTASCSTVGGVTLAGVNSHGALGNDRWRAHSPSASWPVLLYHHGLVDRFGTWARDLRLRLGPARMCAWS